VTNIIVKIEMPSPEVATKAAPARTVPTLRERLEYAIECIELGRNPKEAIAFAQKLNRMLNQKEKLDEEQKYLLELTKPIIFEYGMPAESEEENS
jgi:ribonucleotide reductase alpha subunit